MRSAPIGVLALVLLPGIVAAQEPGDARRPLSLETSVTTSSEYTDNFFRNELHPKSNLRQTITPDLALELTGPFHRARLRYHPMGAYSTLLEELEYFQAVDATAAYEATPFLTVRATEQFSQSDNPAIIDPNTLQTKRFTSTRNTATLELPYFTETWSVTPRGIWTTTANKSTTPQSDERSRILTLGVDGAVTLLPYNTTVRAGLETTSARFRLGDNFSGQTYRGGASRPFGPLFDLTLDGSLSLRQPELGKDFMIRDVGAGGRYQLSETVLLTGRVGYQQSNVTEGSQTQGLTYSNQASYTGAVFSVVTTSDLSFQETFTEVQNVGLTRTQGFGFTVTYQLTEDLQARGSGRWSRNQFLQSGPGLPSSAEQRDTVLTWGVSASYQVARTVKLTSAWDRTQRDSTRVGTNFSVNTFRLELSVDFR